MDHRSINEKKRSPSFPATTTQFHFPPQKAINQIATTKNKFIDREFVNDNNRRGEIFIGVDRKKERFGLFVVMRDVCTIIGLSNKNKLGVCTNIHALDSSTYWSLGWQQLVKTGQIQHRIHTKPNSN